MKTSLPRWKKALFSLLIVAVTATLLELIAITYLRHFKGYDGQNLQWHVYDAYKNMLPARNYEDTRVIHHNSVGFRSTREIPIKKPDDTYRIFLMGGSTAYGLGTMWPQLQKDYLALDDSETISAYLEKQLNYALPGRNIEVINAAISSHWTHHHLIYLNQSILRYEPDMIVFLDGQNDFFLFNQGHNQFASYSHQDHANTIMGKPTIHSLVYANAWWLFRKSAAVHIVGRAARDVSHQFSSSDPKPIDVEAALASHRDVFSNNALKMNQRIAAILQVEDVKGVFVLQPALILEGQRRGMPEVERTLYKFNVQWTNSNYEEYRLRVLPFVRKSIAEAVEPLGAKFVDATGVYKNAKGQMFTDYCHLTPKANEILAAFIADTAVEQIATSEE